MRSYLLITIFLFLQFSSTAQDTSSHQSIFWEVTGNGLVSPSYLYGTTHLICKRDVLFTDTVKSKLAACKTLYREVAVSDDSVAIIQNNMSKKMTLRQIIGRNDFKRVQRFFAANSEMTDSFLNTLNVAKLSELMIEEKGRCKIASIDDALADLAKSDGLPVKGLESLEEHLSYDHKPSISEQADYVFYLLNNIDRTVVRMRKSMDLYLAGDFEKLYRMSAINSDGSKSDIAINSEKRSKIIIPRIEDAMKDNPCFFAFGCNLLRGENGVINLLRLRGYVVRPLYYY